MNFLDCWFPGDKSSGAPIFSEVAWPILINDHADIVFKVQKLIDKFQEDENLSLLSISRDKLSKCCCMYLKQADLHLYNDFMLLVLSLYLNSKDLLKAIGESQEPLFPSGQILPDINYELLENVYSRGKIWRDVDKRIVS